MVVNKDKLKYVGFYAPNETVSRIDGLLQRSKYVKKSEVIRAALDIGLKKLEVE